MTNYCTMCYEALPDTVSKMPFICHECMGAANVSASMTWCLHCNKKYPADCTRLFCSKECRKEWGDAPLPTYQVSSKTISIG